MARQLVFRRARLACSTNAWSITPAQVPVDVEGQQIRQLTADLRHGRAAGTASEIDHWVGGPVRPCRSDHHELDGDRAPLPGQPVLRHDQRPAPGRQVLNRARLHLQRRYRPGRTAARTRHQAYRRGDHQQPRPVPRSRAATPCGNVHVTPGPGRILSTSYELARTGPQGRKPPARQRRSRRSRRHANSCPGLWLSAHGLSDPAGAGRAVGDPAVESRDYGGTPTYWRIQNDPFGRDYGAAPEPRPAMTIRPTFARSFGAPGRP